MKLHTVFITYNRLELTKQAIRSYMQTTPLDWQMVVVDNFSTDGTRKWLQKHVPPGAVVLWKENSYPGKAANFGWGIGALDPEVTHFHRADNDHIFLPGWSEALEHEFLSEKVGLVGLRTSEEELHARTNTGGNCVIRRELWDKGLRWDERTWPELRDQLGPGITEDSLMAPAVEKMGYTWTRVKQPCIRPISPETPEDPDRPYYEQTWRDRGIHEDLIRSGS